MADTRPEFFVCENGEKAQLPFAAKEYEARLSKLRKVMADRDIPAVLLTSMHNIALCTRNFLIGRMCLSVCSPVR